MQTAGINRHEETGQVMKIPAKMTAIAISVPGGPRVLKPETRDRRHLRRNLHGLSRLLAPGCRLFASAPLPYVC